MNFLRHALSKNMEAHPRHSDQPPGPKDPLPHQEPDLTGGGDPVKAFFNKHIFEARKDFYTKWWQNAKVTETIDSFTLHKVLGSGSFGQVYCATYHGKLPEAANEKTFAVKLMKKANVVKTRQVDHAINEKKVSICVDSDFLMKTYFAFQDPINLYIVMDFMTGGEFYLFLRRKGRFPEPMSQFYGAQITLALQYLHGLQLIYRDLKPENILIGANGYIRIGDFGFAKYVPGRTWTLCGTPQYMAPELLVHKSYGKSVDCWGLGIFIYEMCAGFVPFDDPSPMKMYDKIVACNISYPKSFSTDLVDLLGYLIQPDVTKRFGNLKDGMYDVIHHTWFKKVDFVRLHKQAYKAPWKPNAQQVTTDVLKATTKLKASKSVKGSYEKEFEGF